MPKGFGWAILEKESPNLYIISSKNVIFVSYITE